MDVAELQARLVADIGSLLRGLSQADAALENTRRLSGQAEHAVKQIKMDSKQAFETAAVAGAINREVERVGRTAERTADYLADVKLRGAAAIETRLAADSEVDSLQKIERQALKTRAAMGGGGKDTVFGINSIGTTGRSLILAGAAAALPVLPQLAAGTLGLGAAGAGGIGALLSGAAVIKLALSDVTKQAFETQKAFDKLHAAQKALVQELRSLDAGLKTHLEHIAQAQIIPAFSGGIRSAMSPSTVAALTTTVLAFSGAVAQAAREWGKFIGGSFGKELGQLLQNDAKYFVSLNQEFMHGADILVRFLNAAAPLTDWLNNAASGAIKSADAWAQSARGVAQMNTVMTVAKQGLTEVGHVVGGLFNALAALSSATGSFNTLQILAQLLNEIARIVNQNRDALRSFFAGAAQSVQDLFVIIRGLEPVLKAVLDLLNGIARAIGGWRAVIDIAVVAFVTKMALAKLAVAAIGDAAVATTGEVVGLQGALMALGSGPVLAALALAAAAIYGIVQSVRTQTYPGVQPASDGNGYTYTRDGQQYRVYPGGKPGRGYKTSTADTRDGMRGAYAPQSANRGYYQSETAADAKQYGIPPALLLAQINQESGFNPNARSSAGAIGIAQFMPGTAKGMGVNPQDPTSSLAGAARLMSSYYKKYGRWDFALAAYNGGPGAVDYYLKHGYYPAKETTNYVNSILGASGIPGGGEPGSTYGVPGALDQTGMPKTKHPSGINLLPPALAARLTQAQTAALGFGGGGGAGGITNPGAAIHADQAVITDIQNALKYLDAKKQTVAVTREEHALTQQLTTARRALAAAEKTQQQNALAAKERGILGIGTGGADATSTVLSLRAQAKALGGTITDDAAKGIDVTAVNAQLAKIRQVLKNNFVPPDVRQAIASQFASIKQTIAQQLSTALEDAKEQLATAQSAFRSAFTQIANAADAAFSAHVSKTLDALQVMVDSPLGKFLFGGAITQTPAGQALSALQEQHTVEGLQAQLKAAEDAVKNAHGAGTVFDAATGIYSSLPGDQGNMAAAQQQLADAQFAIKEHQLQAEDAIEQTAAQKQLADAKAAYQDQQQLVQQAMDQQVSAIEQGMESGKISADAGFAQLKQLWADNGISLGALSFAMGGQIYVGLAAGLAPIFDMLANLVAQLNRVASLSGDNGVAIGQAVATPGGVAAGSYYGTLSPANPTAGGGAVVVNINGTVYGADSAHLASLVRDQLLQTGRRNGNSVLF